jgi:VWFA-related protein
MDDIMRPWRLVAAVTILAGAVLSAGQAPQPQSPAAKPSQTPTFKAAVEYVEVDAVITDALGNVVSDLRQDEFDVLEDGRRQTITNFTRVVIPIERADRPLYDSEPIEPDVQTNERPFEGRVYVVILDDLHTDFSRSSRVRMAARQFIQRYLGANDLMAVVFTGGRTEAAQEFTANKRLLLAAVDQFAGRKLESATLSRNSEYFRTLGMPQVGNRVNDPYDSERGFNARSTLGLVENVAEWFGGVRGRRKSIVLFSEGIDYDITDVFNNQSASGVIDDTRQAIAAATRSNVSIYAVDPRGLATLGDDTIGVSSFADQDTAPAPSDDTGATARPDTRGIGQSGIMNEMRLSQDSLRTLADETGGLAAVNSNQFARAFDRIVIDNSSYYVLAYYPPSDKRDGKFHKIEVRVKRPGLTVRARRGYVAARGRVTPVRPTPGSGASPEVIEALTSPLYVSGLTMRLFAAPFRGTAPNASVLLGVELVGRDLRLESNTKLEVSYLAVDAKGKTHGARTDAVTLNLRPETRTRVTSSGLRVLNRMDLPPGRYQIRVASHDVGGAVGSVVYDLDVPDYSKAPFSMSGLLLTSLSGASMVTVRPDEQTRTMLPAPPIALRTFPQNDELALFAEVYDDGALPPHKVDIVTALRSDEGTIYFKNEEERDSKDLEGKRGGYGYTARIPMTGVPPGPAVLTVEARSRLANVSAVTRQVRIHVVREVERQ